MASVLLHCFPGLRLDLKFQCGRKPNGAKHPQAIFPETSRRITNGAQHLRLEIFPAADIVYQFLPDRIEEQAIHREVPPLSVFLRSGKRHRFRMSAINIEPICTEGGDLE